MEKSSWFYFHASQWGTNFPSRVHVALSKDFSFGGGAQLEKGDTTGI